jgi:CBS domain-containing protein
MLGGLRMTTTTKIVRDLMVTLEEYSRIPEDASLFDAIQTLERALLGPSADPTRPKDRAVLVLARDGQVIGKLSLWDVLRGLEPRYEDPIEVIIDDYFLWTHAMFVNLAEKAKSIKAKDVLRQLTHAEMIKEDAPLDVAVHQLVRDRLLSLLVVRGDRVVGVLRLSDVFRAVSEMMKPAPQPA